MHRDKGRRRAARVVLMLAILTAALTGIAIATTHTEAMADFSWVLGR
jgi:hypothetical protein